MSETQSKPFTKGAQVRQVVPVIAGSIADAKYDAEKGTMSYLVDYADASGETHQRWFAGEELEAVPAAEETAQ